MKIFKKPVFVSISPNAQADDIWLALKLIFSPWRWINGLAIEKFINSFRDYLGVKYVFTFDSGRTALYAILKALNLEPRDEVLIQAFTCTAAANPILWVGAKPVYVDIEEATYNISPADLKKKISPRSKVLIIQHTFGLSANLDEIIRIARKYNLFVIEDVAHSLGAEYKGKRLGTFGDAAFFSFGRFKIISASFAGAAATNDKTLGKKIEEVYQSCGFPRRFWIFQQLFHPVFLSIAKPFYNIFSIGKFAVILAKKLRLLSLTVYSEEKSGGRPGFGPSRMPNSLSILGLNQLKKLGQFNEHRRRLAKIYQSQLNKQSRLILPEVIEDSKPVFLNFPIQLPDGSLTYKLIGRGRREEGIYLENWPAQKVIGPRGTDLEKLRYKNGSCPVAEKVAPRVIVLPTNPNTSSEDAERVCRLIILSIPIFLRILE